MILVNLQTIHASPYVVFTGLTNPFSTPAVRIDTEYDPAGNVVQNYAELFYPFGIAGTTLKA